VAEVPGCTLQAVERELEQQSHFAINDHALTFFGICQDCGGRTTATQVDVAP
jgi:Fe2+ or Zn2+ uptake regulation protein